MAHYRDPRIETDAEALTLHWYYFPFGSKRIPWNRLRRAIEHDMGEGVLGGRFRIWGSGDLVHWMPLDVRRPKKRWMYILELEGAFTRPCVTPDDPETFRAVLTASGVPVERSRHAYRD
jgi:hypothetical protein